MARVRISLSSTLVVALVGIALSAPATSQTPRSGGVLNLMLREDLPQGFAIHETATISTVWPAMPCLSNLVLFDPLKKTESMETIIGELAEKWSWQDGHRKLVFSLRRNVRWHDGQPFTSRDVKFTFDVVRAAADAPAKLRVNPRKDWYANLTSVETPDAFTAVFRLKKPQPSLLLMLASGYAPVYAAHVPPADYRTTCVGTGPFKLREWRKREFVEYVKNPDYFVKGRPYLNGLKYVVIVERGARQAALQARKLDVSFPGDTGKTAAEQLQKAVPQLVITPYSQNVSDSIIMNVKKPPFDNRTVRRAVSHAIDRRLLVQTVHKGRAVVGAGLAPQPWGVWGLAEKDLVGLPGYGRFDVLLAKASDEKALARKLMAEAGFKPGTPLKVEIVTRAMPFAVDMASFVITELQQVGIDATLKQIQPAQWHAMATRGDYQIGVNQTGTGPDDPDAGYDSYACGSPRNYSQYCNEDVMKMFDAQSQELDPTKRLALNVAIQNRLEADAARPILAWILDYLTVWPHVKNLIPHQSIYNFGRMQEVWIDR